MPNNDICKQLVKTAPRSVSRSSATEELSSTTHLNVSKVDPFSSKKNLKKSKAAMVSNTEKLRQQLDELRRMRQQLKQIVKSHVEGPQWKSFGMQFRQKKSKSGSTPDTPPDDINDDNPIDNAAPHKAEVKTETAG